MYAFFYQLKKFGRLVTFSHTIFLFPFALSSVVLAYQSYPISIWTFFWSTIALISARSAAMITNRIVDVKYDALNFRTKERPLVIGEVSHLQAGFWLVLTCGLFIIATWALGLLCLTLSPIALFFIFGYSYIKRFTAFCHVWLGLTTGLAPLGIWLAITNEFSWKGLMLSLPIVCWVIGFDIIYACQDINFDRLHRLASLPAWLGDRRALWVSRFFHLATVIGFFILSPIFNLGRIYLIGIGFIIIILTVGHLLVHVKLTNIATIFFKINSLVSIVFFISLVTDKLFSF